MGSELTVNRDRLWNTLMEMGKIGALPHGGCSRSALSEDDMKGRKFRVPLPYLANANADQSEAIHGPADTPLRPVALGHRLATPPHHSPRSHDSHRVIKPDCRDELLRRPSYQ